ncbi:MAG: hypothetical protein ACFBSF_17055 [Leptolyngbyaceae cyanobacterium]
MSLPAGAGYVVVNTIGIKVDGESDGMSLVNVAPVASCTLAYEKL